MSSGFAKIENDVSDFAQELADIKAANQATLGIQWYPYNSLSNVGHLSRTIPASLKSMFDKSMHIADIGCADGDLSFFLERQGHHCDVYDYGPTNMNGMRGVRALKKILKSRIGISEVDLDRQFDLKDSYDLIVFLGILYHLKNPFYVMERLARKSRYCLVSTRTCQNFTTTSPDVSDYAAAYLVDTYESNNDPTNYWIFTVKGLHRCVQRAGWDVVNSVSLGCTSKSNPQDADRDQRTFLMLQSRHH